MANRPSRIFHYLMVAVGGCAVAAISIALAAVREEVSVAGWLMGRLAPLFAPDLDSAVGTRRAIEQDRARGPGMPSDYWLRKGVFSDERHGPYRQLRLRLKHADGRRFRLLYLHGGAYVLNLHSAQWTLVGGLLERSGSEVVVPLYPLAPEHNWRDGLEAARQAYFSLLAESPSDPIVIFGDSAGGGLALILAQSLRDSGGLQPAALVLFSPSLDLSKPSRSPSARAGSIEFRNDAGRFWGEGIAADDPRISPIYGDQRNLPPTVVFSGTRDPLDRDAVRLKKFNPNIELRRYGGMPHVWPVAPIPEGRRALDEAAEFIIQHGNIKSLESR
jgi:monoterpene epsilon-lactone hydrolase